MQLVRKLAPALAVMGVLLVVSEASAAFSLSLRVRQGDGAFITISDGDANDLNGAVDSIFAQVDLPGGTFFISAFADATTGNLAQVSHSLISAGNAAAGTYTIQSSASGFDLSNTGPLSLTGQSTASSPAPLSTTFDSWLDPSDNQYSFSGVTHPTVNNSGGLQEDEASVPWGGDSSSSITNSGVVTVGGSGGPVTFVGTTIAEVPEPGTMLLTGVGFPIAGYLSWRRKRKTAAQG